jgi:hypothetical protein
MLINVFFSVVLLAVCDANYHFTFVDIVAYGKSSGSRIFQNIVLRNKVSGNEINIPDLRFVSVENDNIHMFSQAMKLFFLSTLYETIL